MTYDKLKAYGFDSSLFFLTLSTNFPYFFFVFSYSLIFYFLFWFIFSMHVLLVRLVGIRSVWTHFILLFVECYLNINCLVESKIFYDNFVVKQRRSILCAWVVRVCVCECGLIFPMFNAFSRKRTSHSLNTAVKSQHIISCRCTGEMEILYQRR